MRSLRYISSRRAQCPLSIFKSSKNTTMITPSSFPISHCNKKSYLQKYAPMRKNSPPSPQLTPWKIVAVWLTLNLIQFLKKIFLILFFMGGSCLTAEETKELWSSDSPDNRWFAAIRRVPDPDLIWRQNFDDTQLVIFDTTNPEFRKRTAQHLIGGRLINNIEWSPDSRFLVFTTSSTEGHSPWHYHTFVFCVDDQKVRYMDSVVGTVISPNIEFENPDVVILGILDSSLGDDAQENPKKVKVPLGATFKKMRKDESPMGGVSPDGRFYATTGDGSKGLITKDWV
jgi:hypothetical protein